MTRHATCKHGQRKNVLCMACVRELTPADGALSFDIGPPPDPRDAELASLRAEVEREEVASRVVRPLFEEESR